MFPIVDKKHLEKIWEIVYKLKELYPQCKVEGIHSDKPGFHYKSEVIKVPQAYIKQNSIEACVIFIKDRYWPELYKRETGRRWLIGQNYTDWLEKKVHEMEKKKGIEPMKFEVREFKPDSETEYLIDMIKRNTL